MVARISDDFLVQSIDGSFSSTFCWLCGRIRSILNHRTAKALLFVLASVSAFSFDTAAVASNVQIVGTARYSVAGSTVVLTADEIANFDSSGFSGTLRLELWALPSPYTGTTLLGYKLAEYTLAPLSAGFNYSSVNSGAITYLFPPDGTWYYTLVLTEYYGAAIDDGYLPDSYVNFPSPVVIGPPSPPPPPPPTVAPQVGLWWNPNESGSGYALDYKHGVLVVTIYSYATSGAPQWYLVAGPLSGNTFTGTLDKYTNGQCIACSYAGSPTSVGNDGSVTIVFSSPTSATMYLPNGRVTQIQPEAF